MAESLGKAVLELSADHVKLDRDMTDAEKHVDKSAKGMGSKFKSGLQTAMVPAVAVLAGAGAAAKKTIDAASDLGEQVSKTGVVFGNSSKPIQAWSKTTASSIGVSQRAALEAAGTFGNMLVPMGLTQGEAAKMSKSMVTLGADMASFNNASPEETLDALRAGLSGETEPLRRFGVFLNAARVKAEAMSLGLVKASKDTDKIKAAQLRAEVAQKNYTTAVKEHGKTSKEAKTAKAGMISAENALSKATKGSIGELTAAQKAQATYSLIMKDSKAAQGDFARTSTSAANAQRVQAAKTEDLQAKIGQGLLPAYQKLLQIGLQVTDFFSKHTGLAKVAAGVLVGLAAAVVAVNVGMKLYAAGAALVTAAQWAWNTALLGFPLVWIVAAIAAVIAVVVLAIKHWDDIKRVTGVVWDAIKTAVSTAVDAVVSVIKTAFELIKGAVTTYFNAYLTIITGVWNAIKGATTAAWNAIKGAADAVWGAMKTAITTYFNAYKTVITTVWNAIKSATSSTWNAIKGAVDGAVDGVKGLITGAWNAVKSATTSAWGAVKTAVSTGISEAVSFIRGLPQKAKDALGSLDERLGSAARSGMNAFKGGISDVAGNAVELARGIPGRIKGAVGSLGGLLVGEGKAVVQGLINGITAMLPALWGKVKGIAGKIKSLKGPIEKDRVLLVDEGKAIIQGLGKGIGSEFEGLKRDIAGYAPTIQATFAQGSSDRFMAGPPSSKIDKLVNIEKMEVRDAFDEDKLAADLAWKVVSA